MNGFWKTVLFLVLLAEIMTAATISGIVVDANTGESIIGVNVFIQGTSKGSATDLDGFFLIRDIPATAFKLKFSHIAYRDMVRDIPPTDHNLFLDRIGLQLRSIPTEAVEVSGYRGSLIQRDMDIASFEVDPAALVAVPQLGKDVFRLMKYTPSVTISDPYSPQYYVRGSDPGENLVQLDGMTIYNPQHFMGSSAIFNPYAIKNIEMLVGGFDAQYGGRNASILNISSREGHHHEVHGEFRPSISGVTGAIEFPANPGATAMLSGRIISDLSYRVLMGVPNVMADFNGAYQTRLGKTRLRLSAFYARDYMDYSIDNLLLFFPETGFDRLEEGFITNTSNRALGLRINTVLTPNLLLEGQIYHSASKVDNKTYFGYDFEDTTASTDVTLDYKTRIENAIRDNTIKANLSYFTVLNQMLRAGIEINRLAFFNRIGQFELDSEAQRNELTAQAMFLQDKIELGVWLLKLGLRYSRSTATARWRREPRLSLALRLKRWTLKAAYGHYYQYLTTMDSRSNEFIQFLDYYNSLEDLKPLYSIHHIIGIEGELSPSLDFSATVYYKDLQRLYRYSYGQGWFGQSDISEIDQGQGESYGLELLLKGQVGKLSGWIGYTYSRGTRRYPSIMDGKEILFDGDQPHNLKAILLYKLNKDITASSSFQFTSGFPKTWETGMYFRYHYDPLDNRVGGYPTWLTPTKNNVRYPPRLSWEIGWKKKLRNGFGFHLAEYLGTNEAYFTMTIRNLLFLHRDPQWYFYLPDYGYYGLDVELIPSVSMGYSIRF